MDKEKLNNKLAPHNIEKTSELASFLKYSAVLALLGLLTWYLKSTGHYKDHTNKHQKKTHKVEETEKIRKIDAR